MPKYEESLSELCLRYPVTMRAHRCYVRLSVVYYCSLEQGPLYPSAEGKSVSVSAGLCDQQCPLTNPQCLCLWTIGLTQYGLCYVLHLCH